MDSSATLPPTLEVTPPLEPPLESCVPALDGEDYNDEGPFEEEYGLPEMEDEMGIPLSPQSTSPSPPDMAYDQMQHAPMEIPEPQMPGQVKNPYSQPKKSNRTGVNNRHGRVQVRHVVDLDSAPPGMNGIATKPHHPKPRFCIVAGRKINGPLFRSIYTEEDLLFNTTQKLYAHIRKEQPKRGLHLLQCPYCESKSRTTVMLVYHVRTHTDEKPYGCPIPGCDYRAVTKCNLKNHLMRGHRGLPGQLKVPNALAKYQAVLNLDTDRPSKKMYRSFSKRKRSSEGRSKKKSRRSTDPLLLAKEVEERIRARDARWGSYSAEPRTIQMEDGLQVPVQTAYLQPPSFQEFTMMIAMGFPIIQAIDVTEKLIQQQNAAALAQHQQQQAAMQAHAQAQGVTKVEGSGRGLAAQHSHMQIAQEAS